MSTISVLQENASEVSSEKISTYHWLMFVLCFLGNIMGGTTSTLISVYLPSLVKDILAAVDESYVTKVSASISALYFVGWGIGGLVIGAIADRIGRFRSLALSLGLFGLFTALVSVTTSWEMILVFRFLSGFGVGGMLVVNTTLFSEEWPVPTRAIFMGILSIGFPVGIFSSGLLNYLVSGWRAGFMTGFVPIGLAIISALFLRESEKWKASRQQPKEIVDREGLKAYRKDLLNGSIIFGCMLIGLWAVFSWVPTWVQSLMPGTNGQTERGISMMVLGAGGLSGGFVSGWIAGAIGVRKAMLICFGGCFVMSFLLFKGNTIFSSVTILEIAVLSFLFGISQGLLSVYIPQLFPVRVRAMATGFCFNAGRFFTAGAVFFVGYLVTALHGYGNSLFVFSFVFLIGFLILSTSKNRK